LLESYVAASCRSVRLLVRSGRHDGLGAGGGLPTSESQLGHGYSARTLSMFKLPRIEENKTLPRISETCSRRVRPCSQAISLSRSISTVASAVSWFTQTNSRTGHTRTPADLQRRWPLSGPPEPSRMSKRRARHCRKRVWDRCGEGHPEQLPPLDATCRPWRRPGVGKVGGRARVTRIA